MPCPLGAARASWSKVITWPPAFRILRRAPSVTLRAQICFGEHQDNVRIWKKYIYFFSLKKLCWYLPWAWGCPESWHHRWQFPQQQRFCSHGQASSSYGSDCHRNKVNISKWYHSYWRLKKIACFSGIKIKHADEKHYSRHAADYATISKTQFDFRSSDPRSHKPFKFTFISNVNTDTSKNELINTELTPALCQS